VKHKKRRKKSVQGLLGIEGFARYGLRVHNGVYIYYEVAPTNISVLSHANVEIKVRHLMMLLSAVPNLEIICTDSCQSMDINKQYMQSRLQREANPLVKKVICADIAHLDDVQLELSTARQFVFALFIKEGAKDEQIFQTTNRVEKLISEQGFEARRMNKEEIKRFFALYFEASMYGQTMPDVDGAQYLEWGKEQIQGDAALPS